VKVLGVLAMVDDGELDWKVISIRAQDALAPVLNDISDVEKHCPGVVSGTFTFYPPCPVTWKSLLQPPACAARGVHTL
jgi:inorganic pyrophosphatase